MNPRSRPIFFAAGAALTLAACLDSAAPPPPDQPLAACRNDLLELAFGAASALPVNPHVKNRSLAQEEVVAAWLELEQPQRALAAIGQIADWRRGAAYADYANYLAVRGDAGGAQHYLDLALQIADQPAEEGEQSWRGDRIRVKAARALFSLGENKRASELAAGTAESEAHELAAARAQLTDEADFDVQMAALDAVVATRNFDMVRSALLTCAKLFGRFYDDPVRRPVAEERIKSSWDGLPVMVRLELLMELGEQALGHADPAKALALVGEAQGLLDGGVWTPEDQIRLRSDLAALRHRSGDAEGARAQAEAARGLFEIERVRIVDIYRAEALRHLAEAYQVFGDLASARAVYAQALEEATVNPNSRPRAMDLARICASMALRDVEPDASLWERLRSVRASLGAPW